jgi:hypothetical protein
MSDVSGAVPALSTRVPSVSSVIPLCQEAQKELIAMITDAASGNKLKTKEDCMELYHSLTVALGKWVVSGLPAGEQKLALAALWLEKEIATAACFPWLSKK